MYDIDEYEFDQFIHPSNLFKSVEELKEFLTMDTGISDDEYNAALGYMLRLCEEDENYEYCSIIKSYLK